MSGKKVPLKESELNLVFEVSSSFNPLNNH